MEVTWVILNVRAGRDAPAVSPHRRRTVARTFGAHRYRVKTRERVCVRVGIESARLALVEIALTNCCSRVYETPLKPKALLVDSLVIASWSFRAPPFPYDIVAFPLQVSVFFGIDLREFNSVSFSSAIRSVIPIGKTDHGKRCILLWLYCDIHISLLCLDGESDCLLLVF